MADGSYYSWEVFNKDGERIAEIMGDQAYLKMLRYIRTFKKLEGMTVKRISSATGNTHLYAAEELRNKRA